MGQVTLFVELLYTLNIKTALTFLTAYAILIRNRSRRALLIIFVFFSTITEGREFVIETQSSRCMSWLQAQGINTKNRPTMELVRIRKTAIYITVYYSSSNSTVNGLESLQFSNDLPFAHVLYKNSRGKQEASVDSFPVISCTT